MKKILSVKRGLVYCLSVILLSGCALAPQSAEARLEPKTMPEGLLMVWDYDEGIRTNQGGFDHDFERAPSQADFFLQREVRRGEAGRALRLDYTKKSLGWTGYWLHLFESDKVPSERTYLDAGEYQYLSFFVKADQPGVNFEIKLGDEYWLFQEDAVSAGTVDDYIFFEVTTEWQEVLVPLERFPGLNLSRLAVFSINLLSEGEGSLYLDDVSFKKSEEIPTPLTKGTDPAPVDLNNYSNAVWVWHSDRILFNRAYREDFFEACQKYAWKEIFFQMLYRHHNPWTDEATTEILHTEELADFIKEAHEHGLRIHALDGYPLFVLEQYHPMVLSQIDAILEYNQSVEPESRYDGIHLDNEPYQLIGFQVGGLRSEIMRQFLDLNAVCMERVEGSGVEYGIDIPFWWDGMDEEHHNWPYRVMWNEKEQDAVFHTLDVLDNVGIMDYRNEASGADGVIRHAQAELAYGAAVGTDVYVGLETIFFPPEPVVYVSGLPEGQFADVLEKNKKRIAYDWSWYGHRMHAYESSDGRIHLGVQRPLEWENEEQKSEWWARFEEFADLVGERQNEITEQERLWAAQDLGDAMLMDPNARVVAEPLPGVLSTEQGEYAIVEVTKKEFDKVTFNGTDPDRIFRVMKQTAEYYRENPYFRGFAIHYYEPFIEYQTGEPPRRHEGESWNQ